MVATKTAAAVNTNDADMVAAARLNRRRSTARLLARNSS